MVMNFVKNTGPSHQLSVQQNFSILVVMARAVLLCSQLCSAWTYDARRHCEEYWQEVLVQQTRLYRDEGNLDISQERLLY